MGRPPGARSEGYDEKRRALARAVLLAVIDDATVSLRSMADAAGVSRPTLLHYFGSRDGAVQAALDLAGVEGQRHLDALATLPLPSAQAALEEALGRLLQGWPRGVGSLHIVGLLTGLRNPDLAGTYRAVLLDPTVDGYAHLIARLTAAELLGPADPRVGALQLLSPLILGLLHQDGLSGAADRPLDLPALARSSVRAFVAAWPPE